MRWPTARTPTRWSRGAPCPSTTDREQAGMARLVPTRLLAALALSCAPGLWPCPAARAEAPAVELGDHAGAPAHRRRAARCAPRGPERGAAVATADRRVRP